MLQQTQKRKDDERKKKLIIAGLIGLLPFLYFAIIGFYDWTNVTTQDYELGAFFYHLRTPMRTTIATAITRMADREAQTIVTVVMVLLLFIFKKWRTGLWYGLTVLLGAYFLNGWVKDIYRRVRPEEIEHLIEQGGWAFPSGHAMGGMIVYGGLLFLALRYFKGPALRWTLTIFLGILILLIGLSRVYLGVHYLSDVIGGFSLGFTWLTLSIAFLGLRFTRMEFQPKRHYSFKDYSR